MLGRCVSIVIVHCPNGNHYFPQYKTKSDIYIIYLMSFNKIPVPYFDTLGAMRNPFKEPVSSLDHLMQDPPADALLDYQHASEFILSLIHI